MSGKFTAAKARQSKHLRGLAALLTVAAIGAGAATYLLRTMAGPAAGIVIASSRKPADETASKAPGYYELDGDYLSFSYANSFTVQPAQAASPAQLQQNRLLSTSGGTKSLVVTVTGLPSGLLDDEPSYRLRFMNPQTYKLQPQTIQGERVIVASRLDGFEEVAFWPHAGKLATIALSGTATNRATAEATYSRILHSVEWQ